MIVQVQEPISNPTLCNVLLWDGVKKENGMEIYNPITKTLYTTSVYKLDEMNITKNHFNLTYDGGKFASLYSYGNDSHTEELYPVGTAVLIPPNTGNKKGFVNSIPITPHITFNPCYDIALTYGTCTKVPS